MMQHSGLADGRWAEMSLIEQMANIGSEVFRTSKWKEKGNNEYAQRAFERALELFDLTIMYGRTSPKDKEGSRYQMLKEICRMREIFCEAYLSSDTKAINPLNGYFTHFAIAQRLHKQ